MLQYKTIGTSVVKDVDLKSRKVTGYLSSFGNVDLHDDVIVRGAFTKTLQDRGSKILFLNQHNWAQPHGTFSVLMEDDKGMYFESNELPNTSYSNDVLELYARGIIKEHSIGFTTVVNEYNRKENINYIKEVKLYEGSNVTLGANPETPFTGFKSEMTIDQINDQQKRIIKAVRDGSFTDETFMQLEFALKQLQRDAYELGKKTLEQKPSAEDTSKHQEPSTSIINYLTTF